MTDRTELRAYIRYQLAQLSARNAQHEFEHLAFEVARRRVASNLLPATGPVQAGGDQGRDFESYRSYLTQSPLADAAIVAKIEEGILVGAVTLNRTIVRKIKSDLTTIFGSGDRPTRVIYFCEANLPVARRHALQAYCQETYAASLDIFDGEAIADMLADPDLNWIAEKYLEIPANVWPKTTLDERYNESRQRWLVQQNSPENYADFLEVKDGLRTATFEAEAKRDLARWISVMRQFLLDTVPDRLIQKARYEIAVGELRGHGSLDPAISEVEAFFNDISPDRLAVELLDAAVLVNYTVGSHAHGQSSVAEQQISTWLAKVERILEEALARTIAKDERCLLLESQAMLSLIPRKGDIGIPERLERFYDRWEAVVTAIKELPLFPVTSVAKILETMTEFVEPSERMRNLLDRTDKLIAERAGMAAAADSARRRAIIHLKADRIIAAIDELHRMKIESFTGEHIRGSILSMMLISECYEQLGLHIASRHYAAAAMFSALHIENEDIKPFISQAAFRISDTFHVAGEGLTYLYSLSGALSMHHSLATDPHDWTKHEQVQRSLAHAAILRAIARRLTPDVLPDIDIAIASWPLPIEDRNTFIALSEGEPWNSIGAGDIVEKIATEIGQHPFSDLGGYRSARWSAFGVTWEVRSSGERPSWMAALELIGALQIVQVELADTDLVVVPSHVQIDMELTSSAMPSCTQRPDNGSLSWTVRMPREVPRTPDRDYQIALISLMFMMIGEATALSGGLLTEIFGRKIDKGLPTRLSFVRPMRELFELSQPEQLDMGILQQKERPNLGTEFMPLEFDELRWPDGPGPGYSRENAEEFLGNRYRTMTQGLRYTLPRILADERCRGLVDKLRKEGHLDWHILNVIYNVVGQWQVEQLGGALQRRPQLLRAAVTERMRREEREDDPVFDLTVFTEERARIQIRMLPAGAFATWKLTNHRQTPDFSAMKKLLDERYGHSTDDIPHEDHFS